MTETPTCDDMVSWSVANDLLENASLMANYADGLVLTIEDNLLRLEVQPDRLIEFLQRLHGAVFGLQAIHRNIAELVNQLPRR